MITEEKQRLIEEVGIRVEKKTLLSPLAARIYATLILSSEDGLAFEEIVEINNASRSSASNNLKVLVQLGFVAYYKKSGDRKRYYRCANGYVKNAIQQHRTLLAKELEIVEKINNFNKRNNPTKFDKEKNISQVFQDYLKDEGERINKKIKEINSLL